MRSNNFSPNLNEEQGSNNSEEEQERKDFVRKVYCILSVQLVFTLGIIYVFVTNEDLHDYVSEHKHIILIVVPIVLIILLLLACVPGLRRQSPANYIFLAIFTVTVGGICGILSSVYEPVIVLSAVGITAAVCFTLTLFAMQTKIDFTVMRGFFLILMVILFLVSLLVWFYRSHTLKLIYAGFGVIVFSLYLLYDTQLMLGGEHSDSIELDEHVFAALSLYLDVMNIFVYILTLLGDN